MVMFYINQPKHRVFAVLNMPYTQLQSYSNYTLDHHRVG